MVGGKRGKEGKDSLEMAKKRDRWASVETWKVLASEDGSEAGDVLERFVEAEAEINFAVGRFACSVTEW